MVVGADERKMIKIYDVGVRVIDVQSSRVRLLTSRDMLVCVCSEGYVEAF